VILLFPASAESFLADLDELSDDEGPAGSEGEAMQEDEDGDGLDTVSSSSRSSLKPAAGWVAATVGAVA
jgi:hypothetical protein